MDLRTTCSGPPEPALVVEEGGGLGVLMRAMSGEDERERSEGEGDTDRPLFAPTLMLRPVPAM